MILIRENPLNYIREICICNGSKSDNCVTTFSSHGHELLGHGHGDFPKLVTVTVTRDRDRDRDHFAGL